MNGRFTKFLAAAAFGSATMFGSLIPLGTVVSISNVTGSLAPYQATVNGGTVNVICDDPYDVYITTGYTALETQVSELSSPPAGNTSAQFLAQTMYGSIGTPQVATKLYDMLAFLAMKVVPGGGHANDDLQYAIWYLVNNDFLTNGKTPPSLDSGVAPLSPLTSLSSVAQNWVSLAMSQTYGAGYGANVLILTPVCGTNPKAGCAAGTGHSQEFIVVTPEPATYALFGAGLIVLSLGTFRRRRNKANS